MHYAPVDIVAIARSHLHSHLHSHPPFPSPFPSQFLSRAPSPSPSHHPTSLQPIAHGLCAFNVDDTSKYTLDLILEPVATWTNVSLDFPSSPTSLTYHWTLDPTPFPISFDPSSHVLRINGSSFASQSSSVPTRLRFHVRVHLLGNRVLSSGDPEILGSGVGDVNITLNAGPAYGSCTFKDPKSSMIRALETEALIQCQNWTELFMVHSVSEQPCQTACFAVRIFLNKCNSESSETAMESHGVEMAVPRHLNFRNIGGTSETTVIFPYDGCWDMCAVVSSQQTKLETVQLIEAGVHVEVPSKDMSSIQKSCI